MGIFPDSGSRLAGVAGIDAQRLAEGADRLLPPSLGEERPSERGVGGGAARSQPDGFLELADGLLRSSPQLKGRPQVVVGAEVPRVLGQAAAHERLLLVGGRPRLPEQEVAVGIEALGLERDVHPREADDARASVAPPGDPRAIDQRVGVMADLAVAQADLDRAYVAGAGGGRGVDEVPEDVGAVRGQGEGSGRLQHEVGLSERPRSEG